MHIRHFKYDQHTSITCLHRNIDPFAMYQYENTLHDDSSFLKNIPIVNTDFGCFSDINNIICRLDRINEKNTDVVIFLRFFCVNDTLDSICIIFGTQKALKISENIFACRVTR